jgi:hypothetical protein
MKNEFLIIGDSSIYLDRYFALLEKFSSIKKFEHSEGHHVLPKFVFGENTAIRYVGYRTHFLLHELLWKHFRKIGKKTLANKAAYPLVRMCGKNASTQNRSTVKFSSRAFERAKIANRDALLGENNPMFGRAQSPAARQKISASKKGVPMKEEHRQPMIGRVIPDEAKMNMSNADRPPVSQEECDARSARMKLVWEKRRDGKLAAPAKITKRSGVAWNKGLTGEHLIAEQNARKTNARKRKFS